MQPDELKQLRKAMGMTQAEFAAQLGLSHGYIGEMERGEKPIERRTVQAARFVQLKALVDAGKVNVHADDITRAAVAEILEGPSHAR